MKNAEKFQEIFKKFATEVWAFSEKDFLTWLNAEYKEPITKNDLGVDCISRQTVIDEMEKRHAEGDYITKGFIKSMPSVTPQPRWIPASEKYEHHIDHTDCIWYGNDSGCPVTCSQYRDGWNDAMEYIFKDGKGYQPYRREE